MIDMIMATMTTKIGENKGIFNVRISPNLFQHTLYYITICLIEYSINQ